MRPLAVEQSNTSVVVRRAAHPQGVPARARRARTPTSRSPTPSPPSGSSTRRAARHVAARRPRPRRRPRVPRRRRRRLAPGARRRCATSTTAAAPPAEGGGDFAPEARAPRRGPRPSCTSPWPRRSASQPADPEAWADVLAAGTRSPSTPDLAERGVRYDAARARSTTRAPAIRVHGDLHLGQVLRTDAGWFVLDFEGEPRMPAGRAPPARRRRCATSPGCCARSTTRREAALARAARDDRTTSCSALARAWEDRNAGAFLVGYLDAEAIDDLLPADEASRTRRARRLRAGQGGVRGRLRARPPARLGADPRRSCRPPPRTLVNVVAEAELR